MLYKYALIPHLSTWINNHDIVYSISCFAKHAKLTFNYLPIYLYKPTFNQKYHAYDSYKN